MGKHTIKNLKEVEDSAPKFGMSDVLEGASRGTSSGSRSRD